MILEFSLYRKRGAAFWGKGQSRNNFKRALLGQTGELSYRGRGVCRGRSYRRSRMLQGKQPKMFYACYHSIFS